MYNDKKVRTILIIILIANWTVAFAKIIIGNIINSSSLTADGYHSLSDGLSNIVGIVGLYLAAKPVDKNHPYGHKKYENITSLFISGLLMFLAINIIKEAFGRFSDPVMPQINYESLIVLLLTLFINIFVATYEYKKGIELKSNILVADSMHTKSDIFVSVGVLITLLAIKFGAPPIIDPAISLIVAGFILFAAVEIAKQTSTSLLDTAAVNVEQIREIALSFSDVRDVHAIRSRKSGNDIYIDMHIIINPQMTVEKAHQLVHDIEFALKTNINFDIQLLIHTEPDKIKK